MQKFIVKGGNPLNGTFTPSGSKNAALPLICATILSDKKCTLTNVPDIDDVHALLTILKSLGSKYSFSKNVLTIDHSELKNQEINHELICKMRAAILLLGPMLARFGEVKMPFPGGCVIGRRSISAHLNGLETLGVKVINDSEIIHLKIPNNSTSEQRQKVVMSEISVTATENVLMLAASIPGETEIRLAASEPHVQDLCHFLNKLGANLKGIGSHKINLKGIQKVQEISYPVTTDYLEIGTIALAAVLTRGTLTIQNTNHNHLDSFWQKMDEAGVNFELSENEAKISPPHNLKAVKLHTAVFPAFPTDLQAPFAVLLTQAEGISKIFETLFEGRLNYLFELEKMGAKVEFMNPHQAIVIGKHELKGCPVASCDLRAGAAMVIAALAAEGETEISNIAYIDRGYERLDEKLRELGAEITRV